MDYEKVEIELNKEEQDLLDEILQLQKKMDDIDPAKMNGQLLSAIQSKAIDTITIALGISEVLENTAHQTNGLNLKKEYKEYQKWNDMPSSERSFKYEPKFTSGNEFDKLLKSKIPKYNRKDYVGKGPGLSQKDTAVEKWNASKSNGGVYDAYTGKFISNDEKDKSKAYEWEHVKSAKEVNDDKVLNYVLTLEGKRDFLNSKENLVPVNAELNNEKRAVKIDDLKEWRNSKSKKDPDKAVKDYHEINENEMDRAIQTSENKENQILESKNINKSIGSKSKIAVSNAMKSGAKAAIGQLLSITVVEVINEYKNEDDIDITERVKNISIRIKEKAKSLLSTFTDHSISSFVSTFLDAILNSILKIAKNIFKFVKLAIVSLFKAVKILFSKEYSWEVRLQEAMKILGVAVASLIGLALDEIIDKALTTSFPFTAPFIGYLSPVLSGLIVGIGSVLLLQGFQKYQNRIEFRKLQGVESSKIEKRSNINMAQAGISDLKTTQSISISLSIFQGTLPIIQACKSQIDESIFNIKNTKKLVEKNISDFNIINTKNDDLLNLLENS